MKNSSSSIVFKKTWLSLFFAFCIFFTFFFYPQKIDAQNNIGGINLGHLTDYLFVFTNGSVDANWQGATKGFYWLSATLYLVVFSVSYLYFFNAAFPK